MNRRLLKLGAVSATALSLAACGLIPQPKQEELRTEQPSSQTSWLATKATSPTPANTHP
jgi:starvation-inducible outer membrane lipoprotein